MPAFLICPDGMDCPDYDWCAEHKHDLADPCPLEEPEYEHSVPLDKIITND